MIIYITAALHQCYGVTGNQAGALQGYLVDKVALKRFTG